MDYVVYLHFIDFISWGVLDNGPLYCITLWPRWHRYSSSRSAGSKRGPGLSPCIVLTHSAQLVISLIRTHTAARKSQAKMMLGVFFWAVLLSVGAIFAGVSKLGELFSFIKQINWHPCILFCFQTIFTSWLQPTVFYCHIQTLNMD
jgi:hypothetical protein